MAIDDLHRKYKIFNLVKFNNYTENEQQLFEAMRACLLNMRYKWDGDNWDDEDLLLTENSAFIFVDLYPEDLKEHPELLPVDPSNPTK